MSQPTWRASACSRFDDLAEFASVQADLWRETILRAGAESFSGAIYLGDNGITLADLRDLIRRGLGDPVYRGVGRNQRLSGAWVNRKGRQRIGADQP